MFTNNVSTMTDPITSNRPSSAKEEKQKLIETIKIEDKFKTLDEIISFNIFDLQESKTLQ